MKEKLVKATYMCVGALIAFAAYLLGNVNDSINAQPEADLPVLDEIVVRKLRVVNGEGNTVIALDQNADGGHLVIFGKDDKNQVSLRATANVVAVLLHYNSELRGILAIDANEGGIGVSGKDNKGEAALRVTENDPIVTVSNKDGGQAQLATNKNGGAMSIFNNAGQNVLQTSVTHTGGGAINTTDKFGYTTGNVP